MNTEMRPSWTIRRTDQGNKSKYSNDKIIKTTY